MDYAAELETLVRPPKAVMDAAKSGRNFVAKQDKSGKVTVEYPEGTDYASELESLIPAKKSMEIPNTDETGRVVTPPEPTPDTPKTIGDYYRGGSEALASLVTGAVATPIGAIAGIAKRLGGATMDESAKRAGQVMSDYTYTPRGEAGQTMLKSIGDVAGAIPPVLGTTPINSAGRAPKLGGAKPSEGYGSVGAAAATASGIAADASPEIQQAVKNAKGPINVPALARKVEADSLPVKMQLTAGQTTGDARLISNEQNSRAKHPELGKRLSEQNGQLIENANAIKEKAAPDVYATTQKEHGEIGIDAYKAKDRALNEDISAKYKALVDANGGQLPIDGNAFVNTADAALHKALLYDDVPPSLRKTMDRFTQEPMTLENFESLRTNLARIQRSQADGNVKAAAGVIRDSLEELPLTPEAAPLKALADEARAAARARFALIEKDPAYKAVVTGKANPDDFINKFVIGGKSQNVQTMLDNLPEIRQTLASATMNHLKTKAGIDGTSGNFSQAGYNRALQGLRDNGKLNLIFDPESKGLVETLGNVARYTQEQPRGAFVNNSNTLVAGMAEAAKSSAEGAANVGMGGVPVGTWVRRIGGGMQEERAVKKSLSPGAGILLRDIGK